MRGRLTPELSDHGQRQDAPAFRRTVHRCPWFTPVISLGAFISLQVTQLRVVKRPPPARAALREICPDEVCIIRCSLDECNGSLKTATLRENLPPPHKLNSIHNLPTLGLSLASSEVKECLKFPLSQLKVASSKLLPPILRQVYPNGWWRGWDLTKLLHPILRVYPCWRKIFLLEGPHNAIGIGRSLAAPPSHTTGHTDHVPRRFGELCQRLGCSRGKPSASKAPAGNG